jgi:hypothetical protein
MTESILDENEAQLLATQLLPHYYVQLERGPGGRFMGTHRVMAKHHRPSFGKFFKCYAHGASWADALVHLARQILEDTPSAIAEQKTLARAVTDRFWARQEDFFRPAQKTLIPVGRDRFLEDARTSRV